MSVFTRELRTKLRETFARLHERRRRDRDRDFQRYLRRTIGRLKRRETIEGEDAPARRPFEDRDVQKRIAALIGRIAEEPRRDRSRRRVQ